MHGIDMQINIETRRYLSYSLFMWQSSHQTELSLPTHNARLLPHLLLRSL